MGSGESSSFCNRQWCEITSQKQRFLVLHSTANPLSSRRVFHCRRASDDTRSKTRQAERIWYTGCTSSRNITLLLVCSRGPAAAASVRRVRLVSKTLKPIIQLATQNLQEIWLNFQNDRAGSNTTHNTIPASPVCCGEGTSSSGKVLLSFSG